MSSLRLITEIEHYFKSLGLNPIDIQMNEPNVGIPQGWVCYVLSEKDLTFEICWDDAIWWLDKDGDLENILNDSVKIKE